MLGAGEVGTSHASVGRDEAAAILCLRDGAWTCRIQGSRVVGRKDIQMAKWYSALLAVLLLPAIGLLPEGAMSVTSVSDYQSLVELWKKWRQFEPPAVANCVPDYSAAAMSQKAPRLAEF